DGDRPVDRALQCATNKGGDGSRNPADRLQRSFFFDVFKTGHAAISRRQLVIPCYGAGECIIYWTKTPTAFSSDIVLLPAAKGCDACVARVGPRGTTQGPRKRTVCATLAASA